MSRVAIRQWLGRRLRDWADLIDREHAWTGGGFTFTFEDHEGIRIRHDGRGVPIWTREHEYHRAHDESDTAARKRAEWEALPDSTKDMLRKLGLGQ